LEIALIPAFGRQMQREMNLRRDVALDTAIRPLAGFRNNGRGRQVREIGVREHGVDLKQRFACEHRSDVAERKHRLRGRGGPQGLRHERRRGKRSSYLNDKPRRSHVGEAYAGSVAPFQRPREGHWHSQWSAGSDSTGFGRSQIHRRTRARYARYASPNARSMLSSSNGMITKLSRTKSNAGTSHMSQVPAASAAPPPITKMPRYIGLREKRNGPLVTSAPCASDHGKISALCILNVSRAQAENARPTTSSATPG